MNPKAKNKTKDWLARGFSTLLLASTAFGQGTPPGGGAPPLPSGESVSPPTSAGPPPSTFPPPESMPAPVSPPAAAQPPAAPPGYPPPNTPPPGYPPQNAAPPGYPPPSAPPPGYPPPNTPPPGYPPPNTPPPGYPPPNTPPPGSPPPGVYYPPSPPPGVYYPPDQPPPRYYGRRRHSYGPQLEGTSTLANFRFSGLGVYQTGTHVYSLGVSWNPQFTFKGGQYFGLNLGGTSVNTSLGGSFALDYQVMLGLPFGSSPLGAEFDLGGQSWFSNGGAYPLLSANLFCKIPGGVIDRVIGGYSAYLMGGFYTSEVKFGIGFAF